MSQKQVARKFVEYWRFQRGSEKGEDQQFWNSLLGEVLGLEDVKSHIQYQVPVPMKGTTKFLDAWIPETRVLIEHKSRGVNLDAPQAGHNGLTPYEQAVEYDNARSYEDKARWIVTCNFDAIWIYDRSRPLEEPQKITLSELPKEVHRLAFLVKCDVQKVDAKELEISVQAGRIVGKFYDALLKQYGSETPETLAALNRLCVRLVFCLYAEDADIFPKDAFRNLVKATPIGFLRRQLLRLFQTLDTPEEKRDRFLEAELAVFPYTNGGLFRGASESEIPPLTEEIVRLLDGSSGFDWSGISPTIFGALFESTLNPATRRAGGMVYTSIENIHKVIDPLFLEGLKSRADELLGATEKKSSVYPVSCAVKTKLLSLQDEIAGLTFLDPACGSGNFLTETYISLRRLENRIIAALQKGQGELDFGASVKVSISQFHGIEINDFAVTVAQTALWIAESQMLKETAEILHREPDYLPLKDYDGIVEGNALRMEWGRLVKSEEKRVDSEEKTLYPSPFTRYDYIMGNPPFVGHQYRNREQAEDMDDVYADCKDVNYGKLDYVCAWYKKAVDFVLAAKDAKNTKVAFVSTNSICQGESVAAMWKPLFEKGVEIDFVWRTFRWDNEAQAKAHVHCVIVGFGVRGDKLTQSSQSVEKESPRTPRLRVRKIFDGDKVIEAEHINGYLIDAPDVFIENRGSVLMPGLPKMSKGSQPTDGGNLILSLAERDELLKKHSQLEGCIRQYISADDYINNKKRYCLWLKGVSPKSYRVPEVLQRLEAVAEMRRKSPTKSVQRDAETPMLFTQIRQPEADYLVVPEVSSERRRYVPIGLVHKNVIVSNMLYVIANASLYTFGVLISSVHMAWMRVVAGRLKSDYRYTPAVYNNFPWPEVENVANVQVLPITNANCQLGNGECGTENWKMENGTGNIGNTGNIKKTPNLQNSQSPSNESNHSESLCLCAKNTSTSLCDSLCSLRQKIESTAQAILDARALYTDSSLADLYDPLTMPIELRKAHAANDAAVMKAYGLAPHTSEPEIVAHLFRLYSEKVSL